MVVGRTRQFARVGAVLALAALLTGLLLWPLGLTVRGGFFDEQGRFTLAHLQGALSDPLYRTGLLNSLGIACGAALGALLLGAPLALLAGRYRFPGRGWFNALALTPLILPPFVGAIGMRCLLGRYGALNAAFVALGLRDWDHAVDYLGEGWLPQVWPLSLVDGRFVGVVLVEALHLFPIVYLNAAAALANVDPALEEAACGLGASPWTRFRRITLPLMLPGLFAGGAIAFISAFTELGTPLVFHYYQTTPVQVFWGVNELDANPKPYALAAIMLAASVLLYMATQAALGGRGHAMGGKAGTASTERTLSGWRGWAACGLFCGVLGLATAPHLGVVLASFSEDGAWYRSILPEAWTAKHYLAAGAHPLASNAIRNSLVYAGLASVFSLVIGLAIAYLSARTKVVGGRVLDVLAMLPLAAPGLVLALGYWAMALRWPFPQMAAALEGWGLPGLASLTQLRGKAPNPLIFLALAYGVRRLPYVVRSASAGLEQASPQLEEAGANLGAGPWTVFRRIVAPLIAANLIAGAVLAFSFSMLEVSDSLLLAQREEHYPITKAIYDLYARLGDGPSLACALGVWAMLLLGASLLAASALMGKRMGAMFR